MAIQKTMKDPATRASVNYHVITTITQAFTGQGTTVVHLSSYFDKDAYAEDGRSFFETQIALVGVPGKGENPIEWAQARLVEANPDEDVETVGDRYAFAGAEIVDLAPYPD